MASASGSGDDAALLRAQVNRLKKALKELTVKQEQAENPETPDDTTSSSSPSSTNDTNLYDGGDDPVTVDRNSDMENKISDAQIRARFIRGPENKTTDTQMWARFIRGAEEWTARQRTLLAFRSRIGRATGKGDSHITDQDGKRYWKCGKPGHIRRDCRGSGSGSSKAGEAHEADGSGDESKVMRVFFGAWRALHVESVAGISNGAARLTGYLRDRV